MDLKFSFSFMREPPFQSVDGNFSVQAIVKQPTTTFDGSIVRAGCIGL
uniref:Uncharacterized protein n=1 Tax=Arundo donax TaxID=35708 RepID=A0A0A9B786_ARUDO